MPKYIEKAENQTLPLVVLRGVVTFPGMTVNCDIPTDSFRSGAAAQSAATVGENILWHRFWIFPSRTAASRH